MTDPWASMMAPCLIKLVGFLVEIHVIEIPEETPEETQGVIREVIQEVIQGVIQEVTLGVIQEEIQEVTQEAIYGVIPGVTQEVIPGVTPEGIQEVIQEATQDQLTETQEIGLVEIGAELTAPLRQVGETVGQAGQPPVHLVVPVHFRLACSQMIQLETNSSCKCYNCQMSKSRCCQWNNK